MERQSHASGRGGWIALALLGIGALLGLGALLDLGPFADDSLPSSDFVARGDEICAQAHEDFSDAQKTPPRTATEAKELTETLLAVARDELDAIEEMEPPAQLAPAVERYLEARRDGISQLQAGADAARRGDALAYEAAQAKLAAGQIKRRGLARTIGFSECSRVLFGRDQ